MNTVLMIEFGETLTDRADGKKAFAEIMRKNELPMELDFTGVISLGSSFGDEVILNLAKEQSNQVTIKNTNKVIKNSVRRIVEERNIDVLFKD